MFENKLSFPNTSWPFPPLTYDLKARQEALEEVFTGVGQGQGTKL